MKKVKRLQATITIEQVVPIQPRNQKGLSRFDNIYISPQQIRATLLIRHRSRTGHTVKKQNWFITRT